MELWVHGETELQIPLPAEVANGELYFQGPRPGGFGEKVASECMDGILHFKAFNNWSLKHLFFVAR